jgi:hypothetical protein
MVHQREGDLVMSGFPHLITEELIRSHNRAMRGFELEYRLQLFVALLDLHHKQKCEIAKNIYDGLPTRRQPSYINDIILVDPIQLAHLVGCSTRKLENNRAKKIGLPYHRYGREIRYNLSDVLDALRPYLKKSSDL